MSTFQHHDSHSKSSNSESHELSDIHYNPASSGVGGNQSAALPAGQYSNNTTPALTGSTGVGSGVGSQAALPAAETTYNNPSAVGSTGYTSSAGATPTANTTGYGTQPGYGTQESSIPTTTTTTGYTNPVGTNSTTTPYTNTTSAPVNEMSRLGVSSSPGTSINTTTTPGYTNVEPSATRTNASTATGAPAVGSGIGAPGAYGTTATGVPTSATTAVPGQTSRTAPVNESTEAAALNADAALNRALNTTGTGRASVGGSSTAYATPGTTVHSTSGVNSAPVERSAVAAADSAKQALGSVLGGTPNAAIGRPTSVETTTTTPGSIHTTHQSAIPPTVTQTNSTTGIPTTVTSEASGASTRSHSSFPASTVVTDPAQRTSTQPATGVPTGTTGGVVTPLAYHDTSTNPAAVVAGTHPNPTHVSNQYKPGSTYNTSPVGGTVVQQTTTYQ